MSGPEARDPTPAFLSGGGVSGELARSVDWARTPLGPPASWPQSLRTIVNVILHSRHPMFLWWGPELIQFYNDAYLPSFGQGKHPAAMGQRGRDCWQEIWPIIGPQIDDVMTRGRSSWNEDHMVPIHRNDRTEEVYWTYGYSPVFDEAGRVGGTLVVCAETTQRVVSERRSRTLLALGDATAWLTDTADLFRSAAGVLKEASADIPFGLFYLSDPSSPAPRIIESFGFDDALALDSADVALRRLIPALEAELRGGRRTVGPVALPGPGPWPRGPWPEPATAVVAASLVTRSAGRPTSLAVFGISPRLTFDEGYGNHLAQIADHIASAHARIEAFGVRAVAESERNNLLLQAPVAAALLVGPQHVFRLANRAFLKIAGDRDVTGKTFAEAFPTAAAGALSGILDRVYQTGQPFAASEYLVPLDRPGEGTVEDRFFSFNLEALRDQAGAVYGMMAVAADISEHVRTRHGLEKAHAEREKLLEQLEAASRSKDEFLAMLGHELRNPLSPIVTSLRLIKLKGDSTTTREWQVIDRQVEHLTRLVDDLLDISKITRGKVELRRETVEIASVIDKAIEMASVLLEQRSHRLSTEVPRAGLLWSGDPVRLAQVVANLLTNAARYTPPGGDISLQARREHDDVVISVKDNGVGISPEMLPRIFELFVQGKRSTDRFEGGLGIGLTLVRTLVAAHGGNVVARSDGSGKGSEFVITLPAAADGAVPSIAARVPPLRALPHGKRVLVVDDNEDAADLLAEALRAVGHEVAIANDPVVALSVAARFRPEIAVLDIGLPVMDGYELATRLRQQPGSAACRLIALTGYGQDHDRVRSLDGGFQTHLVKPVDLDRLMSAVDGSQAGNR
jgi:signal transduction histidine kinase/CheY-like chemotaxis protein